METWSKELQAELFQRLKTLASRFDASGALGDDRIGKLRPLLESDGIRAVTQRILSSLEPLAIEKALSDDLRAIAQLCEQLGIAHNVSQADQKAFLKQGLLFCQHEIYLRLKDVAQEIGLSDRNYVKQLEALRGLFQDSGVAAVAQVLRGELEALLIVKQLLQDRLPHLHSNAIKPLLLAREELRNDPLLYVQGNLYAPDSRSEPDPLREQLRLQRLSDATWSASETEQFYLENEDGQASLCLASYVPSDHDQRSWVHVKLSTLDDQLLVESDVGDPTSNEAEAPHCQLDPLWESYPPAPSLLPNALDIHWQLQQLKVRHIPRLTSHKVMSATQAFLGQEHYRGQNAALRLSTDFAGGFDWPRFRLLTRTVLEHLEDLHKYGFVHRGIKPANLLLQQERSSSGVARISKAAITGFKESSYLNECKKAFEPLDPSTDYFAPEIWTRKKAGKAADIWSAGATLFELRYGLPFLGGLERVHTEQGYEKSFLEDSSRIPKCPLRMETYYRERASEGHGKEITLDAVDILILTLISRETEERPSAESALKTWSRIESQMDSWEFSRGLSAETGPLAGELEGRTGQGHAANRRQPPVPLPGHGQASPCPPSASGRRRSLG
jgi:hypothetical protein